MEHIYKTIAGFVYAFQRTHFQLEQLLVQLDGRELCYAQDGPSPAEFMAEAVAAGQVFSQLDLPPRERELFDTLASGLQAVAQLYQRLTLADFRLPEREIALATEACRKTQQLLRQCGQVIAARKT